MTSHTKFNRLIKPVHEEKLKHTSYEQYFSQVLNVSFTDYCSLSLKKRVIQPCILHYKENLKNTYRKKGISFRIPSRQGETALYERLKTFSDQLICVSPVKLHKNDEKSIFERRKMDYVPYKPQSLQKKVITQKWLTNCIFQVNLQDNQRKNMGVCGQRKEMLDENEKKKLYSKKITDRCLTVQDRYSSKEKNRLARKRTLYLSNLTMRKDHNCEQIQKSVKGWEYDNREKEKSEFCDSSRPKG